MARFKCVASGCTVIADRRRAPASCPDTNRCEFEEYEAPPAPVEPPPPPPPPPPANTLRVQIGDHVHVVSASVVLGRNGDIDVESFRRHLAVSRRHCQLTLDGASWTLTPLAASSPTALDGRAVAPGQQVPLSGPSHHLLLGGTMEIRLLLDAPATDSFTGALDEFFRNQETA